MSYQRPAGGTYTTTGPEIHWDDKNGWRSEWTHEGTEAEMVALRAAVIGTGANMINQSPSGNGLFTLRVSYPWAEGEDGDPITEDPQDIHEIEVQVEQPPVWNSEVLHGLFASQSQADAYVGVAKAIIEKFLAGGYVDENGDPDITTAKAALASKTSSNAVVAKLFDRVTSGTDAFIEYRNVYRRTITAASYTQIQASYTGAGQIWTTAEVVAFEGTPEATWFGLPADLQWLKAPPTVQAVSGGKTQIQYYYSAFKQATALLYTAYSGATLLDA